MKHDHTIVHHFEGGVRIEHCDACKRQPWHVIDRDNRIRSFHESDTGALYVARSLSAYNVRGFGPKEAL